MPLHSYHAFYLKQESRSTVSARLQMILGYFEWHIASDSHHAFMTSSFCIMQAFKSPSQEMSRILDVVGHYAVLKPEVGFTVKKQARIPIALMLHQAPA